MNRARAPLPAALAALALAACPGPDTTGKPAASRPAAAGNRLSVLLVTIDTLRADHLGAYGYRRATSPNMDALARRGVVFDQAYTYWPKTRGSFVAMLTGRLASQTGYGKSHPLLLEFNPTLASVLRDAGYETAATVDNPNVAASLGYAKGFSRYRETWEETALATEMDRTRAITGDGVRYLGEARPDRPFLLWLHYVNPHAPYEPPPPWDTAFLDAAAARGDRLRPVEGFHGGVPRQWSVPGRTLGGYVARYDGEIAAVDAEVGKLLAALDGSAVRDHTLVVITSDHGESLGEHDYYFDHGEDLFDPSIRVPLLVAGPGIEGGRRSDVLATTLDLVPTVLDAVKVSYPPDLAGESLLPAARGEPRPDRPRLQGQNDRNLLGAWGRRFKIVATPSEGGARYALYDRASDPGETRDASRAQAQRAGEERRALELVRGRIDAQLAKTRRLLEGRPGEERLSPEACEKLKAMGYVQQGCS
ncbi:MAG TPA: sulfatase [Vicinamibacteria bacterium]|nr:sulfatase [Vicinamibacteria bacterium]